MKTPRIRRFPRRASDAHLLTPPDTKPFTYVLDCSDRYIGGWQPLIDDLAANGITPPKPQEPDVIVNDFMAGPLNRDFKPYPLSKLVETARHSAAYCRVDTWEEQGGFCRYARITRRPKISPKLLANLPPLQRQRMNPHP